MMKIKIWKKKKPAVCKHAVKIYPFEGGGWSEHNNRWIYNDEFSVTKCKLALDAVEARALKGKDEKYISCLCPLAYNLECARYEPIKESKS